MNIQNQPCLLGLILMLGLLPAFSGCVSPTRPIPVNKEASASLVVLMQHEPESQALADKLQPMLESELSQQWQGTMSARSESATIPAEHEPASAGQEAGNTDGDDSALKPGMPGHAGYLLTVKAMPSNVTATLALFPAATVLHEQTFSERLDPFSLSFRIATAALKGIRQSVRDPNRPLVSIGSFTSGDPYRRFFEFCHSVDGQLCQELANEENIELAERLFPPELLKESELDREGLLAYVAHHLVAPTPDILLYGEFQPRTGQQPDATNGVLLEVTVHLMFPTGLCPRQEATFSCRSDKPEALVRYIVKRFKRAADLVSGHLLTGAPRGYSEEDFSVFKQQALKMMPHPHDGNGNYHMGPKGHWSWCVGDRGLYNHNESVLHRLECAMMLKGDDSQVLACMGVALFEMARPNGSFKPEIESLDVVSHDMFERAYRLESNWNTRGLYASGRGPLKFARQIWADRQTEPWLSHEIHYNAFLPLLRNETNLQKQQELFFEALPDYVAGRYGSRGSVLRNFYQIVRPFIERVDESDTPEALNQLSRFSERLCGHNSLFIRELGHILRFKICVKIAGTNPRDEAALEFAEHFRSAISLLPEIRKAYGDKELAEWSFDLNSDFERCFADYTRLVRQYGLKDESDALRMQYDSVMNPINDIVAGWFKDRTAPQVAVTKLTDNTIWTNSLTIWTNSLGMKFVPVTGVVCRFSIWETRVKDYRAFVKATRREWPKPDFQQEPDHPAVNASWNDARAFCVWLTEKEVAAGALPTGWEYRLPTDAEWSAAVALQEASGGTPADKDGKVTDAYPWGNDWPPKAEDGNYHGEEAKADNRPVIDDFTDGFMRTSPVGSFKTNTFGLFDMGGNVWEWCEDEYEPGGRGRVLRGASWHNLYPWYLLSSFRSYGPPDVPSVSSGFRCVVAPIVPAKKKLIHRDR